MVEWEAAERKRREDWRREKILNGNNRKQETILDEKMGLRGRSQEEQLLTNGGFGGSPRSSALFNGAAHEYCMIPAVGLPGRAEPRHRAGIGACCACFEKSAVR